MTRKTLIQHRRDTADNWTSVNPVLAEGELGVELGTSKVKIGDGTTAWTALPYLTGNGSTGSTSSAGFETIFLLMGA
jgi:hypothetical protein